MSNLARLPIELQFLIADNIKNMWKRQEFLKILRIDGSYHGNKNKRPPFPRDFVIHPNWKFEDIEVLPPPLFPDFPDSYTYHRIVTLTLPLPKQEGSQIKMYKFQKEIMLIDDMINVIEWHWEP